MFFKDIAPGGTENLTWTAPRNGTVKYIDFTFYETEELLKVYATLNGNLNIITYATGSLEYIALHNQSIRIYCNKQFAEGDVITIKGVNEDTDPEGTHRLRVLVTVELL